MKTILKIILGLTLTLFISSQLNYLNITDLSSLDSLENFGLNDEDINKDQLLLAMTSRKIKQAACLVLIRNSLNNWDSKIKQALDETKLDKSQTFDKIIILMLEGCNEKISNDQTKRLLTLQNILTTDDEFMSLLNFNGAIFSDPFYQLSFSEDEQALIKEFSEVKTSEDNLNVNTSTELGLETSEKTKYIAIGASSTLAIVLFIVLLKSLFFSQKEEVKSENNFGGRKKRN
jgi:hypothetical protein